MNDSGENEFTFQGLALGLNVPLDRRSIKVRNQQLELQHRQLEHHRQALVQQRSQRSASLKEQLTRLHPVLAAMEDAQQSANRRIQAIARLQFEQGTIDFLTFYQIQKNT